MRGLRRKRLDQVVVERGLAQSRERARELILAGKVRVGKRVAPKPATEVEPDVPLAVEAGPRPFASRGGEKLQAALDAFGADPAGRICVDVGASTGGFTDCLLRRGAGRVYAVDVGRGQLGPLLRGDPRVVPVEETNIRFVRKGDLPEAPDLATVDVSFISLRLVLPVLAEILAPPREIVALIKPQFEVGKGQVGRGGVVREPAKHRSAIRAVAEAAQDLGLHLRGLVESPLRGPKGNREFFIHLDGVGPSGVLEEWLAACVPLG